MCSIEQSMVSGGKFYICPQHHVWRKDCQNNMTDLCRMKETAGKDRSCQKAVRKKAMIIFGGLCVYYFVAFGLIYNGLGMFLTPISENLDIPFVQVSMSSTVRILTGMATTAAAGYILPKVKLKWFLSMNVLFLAGASALISVSHGLIGILAGSAWMGFAAGFALYAIVPIVLNQWFAQPERYVSIVTAVGGAGGILFCPVITWAISELGWREAYRMIGVIVLAVMLPISLFIIRYSPTEYGLQPYGTAVTKENNCQQKKVCPDLGVRTGDGRGLLICLLVFFLAAAVLSGMYGHVASAFWVKGFYDNQVGMLTAFYQAGTTVMQLLFGLISAKIGLRKTLNVMFPLIVISCAGMIFVKSSMFNLTAFFALLLGTGRAFGVINPLMTRYVYGAADFTRIYSGLYAAFLVSTAVTATLFGTLYDLTGSYNAVYLLILGCTILEIVVTQVIFRLVRKRNISEDRK